ncbi:MAG: hypothetical protein R3332_03550 [Pseudohongiellaceae bacterium]|nr:hypothetical protein [Pseudohongiellaceae bacterium]
MRADIVRSANWQSLSPASVKLMSLMHVHWRPAKPVDYGVREAMDKIGCAKLTARKAFQELQDKGFIVMVDESLFSSRSQSRTRTWRLTWLPFKDLAPTNDWEKLMLPD